MAGGACRRLAELPDAPGSVVEGCRRATLGTLAEDGTIAAVPVCFAVDGDEILIAVDEKPKGTKELARVRNIRRDACVTLLFDTWDEDWTRLGWVMVKGVAVVESSRDASPLLERYPQYQDDPPGGPFIVVTPRVVRWWRWS